MADAVLHDLVKDEHISRSRQMREIKKSGKAVVFLDHIGLIQNAQEMTEAALRPVWALIRQFNQSMEAVCQRLRTQAGFYAGCTRLYRRLETLGVPLCFPELNDGSGEYRAAGLADAGLALLEGKAPVGNDVQGSGIRLWVVTGANQGGKTTFLRSVGLAQVMAQSGLFAAARSFSCPVYSGVYTHFPNGEDKEMNSGLLEVELRKLDGLIRIIRPGALLLMNESFATTTPGEAAFLSGQLTRALRESGVTTFFVTHLFGFADALRKLQPKDVRFLRAPREEGGGRSYRLEEGAPGETSYALDLFPS
jgi:DNA mismatch repair ATPase MutS